MPWALLTWLLAVILQCALLGCCIYQLIQLSDLECDLLNPHDASRNINAVVLPEYLCQAALTVFLLLSGHWAYGGIQLLLLAYHARLYMHRAHLTDVTEIFREVSARMRREKRKLAFYILTLVLAMFKMLHIVVLTFLTPAGRKAAAKILRDAAASMHRRI